MHAHIHPYIQIHISMCHPSHTHIYTYTYIYTLTYINIHTYIYVYAYIYTHTYINIHTYIYIHTYIHIYTHIYKKKKKKKHTDLRTLFGFPGPVFEGRCGPKHAEVLEVKKLPCVRPKSVRYAEVSKETHLHGKRCLLTLRPKTCPSP